MPQLQGPKLKPATPSLAEDSDRSASQQPGEQKSSPSPAQHGPELFRDAIRGPQRLRERIKQALGHGLVLPPASGAGASGIGGRGEAVKLAEMAKQPGPPRPGELAAPLGTT